MLATLVVAVALALARVAPSPDAGAVWPVWAVAVTVASVISSISLLPAGALLLRMRLLSRGLAWSGLYAGALIALPWVVAAVQWWYDPALLAPRAIYVGLSSLMFTFAATLMLTAVIARDRGYRLTGGRKRLPQPRFACAEVSRRSTVSSGLASEGPRWPTNLRRQMQWAGVG